MTRRDEPRSSSSSRTRRSRATSWSTRSSGRPSRARSGRSSSRPSTSRAPATSSTRTRAAQPRAAGSTAPSRRCGPPGSRPTATSFDGGPLDAVKDVLAQEQVDELIVSTHPEAKSGWLRREPDRRDPQGSPAIGPVEHIVADVAHAPARRTCSSSRTRPCSASRCSTASGHARAEGPPSFLIICPQCDPLAGRASRGRAASARGARRSSGPRGSRPTGRSRTPTRTRRRCRRSTTSGRRGDRLDVPRRALRLAPARPRRAPARRRGLPVEHVDRRPAAVEVPA